MTTGTIKRVTDRGFGFIGMEGKDDVFFHSTSLQDTTFDELRVGQTVQFEIEADPRGKGDRAANVRTS